MPPATGAVAILPIIALWLVNACQEGAGMSALNSELTRKHAATNLQHLMTLPPPVAGDGTDPASEKRTESIHYLHNITHPDGAHDLVHYNVSSEVGLISLDFIPEVLAVECTATTVTVQLSDIAAASEWRAGIGLVGDRTWGCLGVPVRAKGSSTPAAAHGQPDAKRVPMPFYRRITSVEYRSEASDTIKLFAEEISVGELFHGRVQIKHTAAGPPKGSAALEMPAPEQEASATTLEDSDDVPAYDIHEILGGERRLQSAGRRHVSNCNQFDDDCSGCIESEDTYIRGISGGDCSFCACDGKCTSTAAATCFCGNGWIGECGARCVYDTCGLNSQCSATNNGECNEGDDRGECPDGSDRNDCEPNRALGCEHYSGTTCRRCMEAMANGGGWCGWDPDTEVCQTSRFAFGDGFDRCACSTSDNSEELLHNGKCDGIPGWVSPGTGVCVEDTESITRNGKVFSCSGDLDKSATYDLFRFGAKGVYTEHPGLPSASSLQTMAYARLSSSYHLKIDFDYDSFIGVPTGLTEVEAELGGAFEAGAGYKLDLEPQSQAWPYEKIWEGDLGDITVWIGPVPLNLDFSGKLGYTIELEMEGGSITSNAEITVEKHASVGLHYQNGRMTKLLDNSPMTHTMAPPTIDASELVAQGLRAAVTLTVIPEVTLTLQGILPVRLTLEPAVRVEGALAPQTLSASAGVSVSLGAEAEIEKLDFSFLGEFCDDQPECVSVESLGGILPYEQDFTILAPACLVGTCNAPPPANGAAAAGTGAGSDASQFFEVDGVGRNCASQAGVAITDVHECEDAASALGKGDTKASTTAHADRPEGCYYTDTLWLATNPVNQGQGANDRRKPLCKRPSGGGGAGTPGPPPPSGSSCPPCLSGSHRSSSGGCHCACDSGYSVNSAGTACVQSSSSSCPSHTHPSSDGSGCTCDGGYSVNSAGTACEPEGSASTGSCQYENDGECDVPQYCPEGTDTADCGSSSSSCPSHTHRSSSGGCACDSGYSANSAGTACEPASTGSCRYENDGECDVPLICPEGTDVADCAGPPPSNTCRYANDGECDEPSFCSVGTDCSDCGTCGGHRRLGPSNTNDATAAGQ